MKRLKGDCVVFYYRRIAIPFSGTLIDTWRVVEVKKSIETRDSESLLKMFTTYVPGSYLQASDNHKQKWALYMIHKFMLNSQKYFLQRSPETSMTFNEASSTKICSTNRESWIINWLQISRRKYQTTSILLMKTANDELKIDIITSRFRRIQSLPKTICHRNYFASLVIRDLLLRCINTAKNVGRVL